jgi:hypothetical protein
MSVRFLFLILFPLAVTMEQEYYMREDYTNVAIPFRLLYGGKFNSWEVLIQLFLLLIHRAISIVFFKCFHVISATILVT